MSEKKYSTFDIRLKAINDIQEGLSISEVAKIHQTHRATVYRWWNRYLDNNEKGIYRKSGSGRPRRFEELDTVKFYKLLSSPAKYFHDRLDLWTCSRIRQAILSEFGLEVSKCTVWRIMRDAKLTFDKIEKRYHDIDFNNISVWKGKEWPRIRRLANKLNAIIYFFDEVPINLESLTGDISGYSRKKTINAKSMALSSVTLSGGAVFQVCKKNRVTSNEVIYFLNQILQYHSNRHLIVIMDSVPSHVSKSTLKFIEENKKLHCFYLP